VAWWTVAYRAPAAGAQDEASEPAVAIRIGRMLASTEVRALVFAKFLSDGAWYFYLFWLPKYLFDTFKLDIKTAGTIGWIPYAAAGFGALLGGSLSSLLLRRGASLNWSRKIALGISAGMMPWVMLVPHTDSVALVIFLFSVAFFGQQSWSTLVMVLPTDMIPKRAVGTLAGLVGFGGAMGGVAVGQVVGWLRDHGYSYEPVLILTGSMHILAFVTICVFIPDIKRISLQGNT
jgi:ACS family hexuronate transporter-like MFS transporter